MTLHDCARGPERVTVPERDRLVVTFGQCPTRLSARNTKSWHDVLSDADASHIHAMFNVIVE